MSAPFQILHHGAAGGVTGSCHELRLGSGAGVLVDCGLFQGEEAGAAGERPGIEFPVAHLRALVLTHVHIDHCGRTPYLLGAGFTGPIITSAASARLLPLVLEDALQIGVTRDRTLIDKVMTRLRRQLVPLPYGQWRDVDTGTGEALAVRLQRAGHILGSAWVDWRIGTGRDARRVVFSGDLGAPYTPLLPAPRPPYQADVLVLESTYGDRLHEDRRTRRERLAAVIERALADAGTVLIPAFSIGRTQELLYEIEDIIHRRADRRAAKGLRWRDLHIVVDSPLAHRFTRVYRQLAPLWDAEARRRLRAGRHPLSFEQMLTVDGHDDHLAVVRHLRESGRAAVVLAASGMCAGGRIVDYLHQLIGDPRTDIVFVGYQARGTPGRAIQDYGPRGGYVDLEGRRHDIRARVHTLGGYSAHADQRDLLEFVRRMRRPPRQVRIVHGDDPARRALAAKIRALGRGIEVRIPGPAA